MTGIAKTARERIMELPVSVESVALAPEIPALLIARVFESGVKWTRRISLVYGFCPRRPVAQAGQFAVHPPNMSPSLEASTSSIAM